MGRSLLRLTAGILALAAIAWIACTLSGVTGIGLRPTVAPPLLHGPTDHLPPPTPALPSPTPGPPSPDRASTPSLPQERPEATPEALPHAPTAPPLLPSATPILATATGEPPAVKGGPTQEFPGVVPQYTLHLPPAPPALPSPTPISSPRRPGAGATISPAGPGSPDKPPAATLTPSAGLPDAPSRDQVPTAAPPATAGVPATRLHIPALGIDAPVVEVPLTGKTWDVSPLTQEIAHLGGTGNPGEKNNMVLAGHVTLKRGAGPFLRLENLKPGDLAIVYAGDQPYVYRVVSKQYVAPSDVSVAYPTSDPLLTLITCASWDAANRSYTQRMAVICELDEEETASANP